MLGSSATFSRATGNDSRNVLCIVWQSWLQNTTVFILDLLKYSRFLAAFLWFFLLLEWLLGFITKQFWNMNRVEWLTFGWGLRWRTIFLSHKNSSGHKLYFSFEFLGKVNTWTFNCKLLNFYGKHRKCSLSYLPSNVTSRQINPFTLNILCETQVITYSSRTTAVENVVYKTNTLLAFVPA